MAKDETTVDETATPVENVDGTATPVVADDATTPDATEVKTTDADPNPTLTEDTEGDGTDDDGNGIPARIVTNTPVDKLKLQETTSGPSNPQVQDEIINEPTNDDIVAALPKTKNAQGVEQVHIDENGFIEGLGDDEQPLAPAETK